MSTGLPVFDTTVQQTNVWLNAVATELDPCDRHEAYSALRAVLHVLRDRLPTEAVIGLSAQLPMLLRGLFLEGWRPGAARTHFHDLDGFVTLVARQLPPGFPHTPAAAIVAVFAALGDQIDAGEVRKLVAHLPEPLREAWPFRRQPLRA